MRKCITGSRGLVLQVVVHPANVSDRDGARMVLAAIPATLPALTQVWADAGYSGQLIPWAEQTLGLTLTAVKCPRRWERVPVDQEPSPAPPGFTVLPRRWVVERTFAWLGRNRRLSKDYEALPETEQAWIFAAMTQLMTHRLAQ